MISLVHDSGNCEVTLDVKRPGSKRPKVIIDLSRCSKRVRKQIHEQLAQADLGSHVSPVSTGPGHTLLCTIRLNSHIVHVRRQQATSIAQALCQRLDTALTDAFPPGSIPQQRGSSPQLSLVH